MSRKSISNLPRRESSARKCKEKVLSYNISKLVQSELEESLNESSSDEILIRDAVKDSGISGKEIYGFNRVKKHERVINSQKLKKKEDDPVALAKTPFKLRKGIGLGIRKCLEDEFLSDEFSDSGSEYSAPSNSNESESDSELEFDTKSQSPELNSDSEVEVVKMPARRAKKVALQKAPTHSQKTSKYVINTEEYFTNNASTKAITSNHSLDKLKTPRLNQGELRELLSKMQISKEHKKSICGLTESAQSNFNKWMGLLHENFNLLLYGLGSKLGLLRKFHKEMLKDLPVVVVNGFFPSLTIKDILDSIINDMLGLSSNPANAYEACDLIVEEFKAIPEQHVYVIVHNIDGDMLRNNKSQSILASLASVKNIHLIASIDHINAPLVWDHNKLSKFKFVWWDVTSFLAYIDETSYESSLMVQRTGNLALSSLRNVFLSLTSNSKGIYLIILKHQLENSSNRYYQGILFKSLYSACRETFLVSSDLALRAQLNEFVDHKMVKIRRSVDGGEYLIIPIQNTLLQQFLNEQNK